MVTIDIGTMVHQVTVQQVTNGLDTSGAPLETWSTLCEAWMSRVTGYMERANEAWQAGQLSAASFTRWTMRYRTDMDPDLVDVQQKRRLLYQGRVYDIVAAETIDRRDGIVLRTLASSKVPS